MFITTLILVLAVLIAIDSCATRKKAISKTDFLEAYSGTWINKDYLGGGGNPQKVVHFPDGKWEGYPLVTSDQRYCHGNDTIIELWTDSKGDIWYTASRVCHAHVTEFFIMGKISDSGNTLETLFGSKPIEEWDIDNPWYSYAIRYRQ
jgi:hypothetical protein